MSSDVRQMLEKKVFFTNAGTETYLVFQQRFELPEFCAFVVHEDKAAWSLLEQNYLLPILNNSLENNCGLMLDALVWRAHPDYLAKLGRESEELGPINRLAVTNTRETIERWRRKSGVKESDLPVLIVADIGPRGDGYRADDFTMNARSAMEYHRQQLETLAEAGVDLVCALTMTTAIESIGIAEAATACGLPIIISPTVETDGRLPDGSRLGCFIEQVDAATESTPLFYMVNCAHPNHLLPSLNSAKEKGEAWLSRFRGFRANASMKSHAELDCCSELDRGDIDRLGKLMADMQSKFNLCVVGGCCGTDHEHLAAMMFLCKPQSFS